MTETNELVYKPYYLMPEEIARVKPQPYKTKANRMTTHLLRILVCTFTVLSVHAQDASYVKTNAVRIHDPERLSDSIYRLLAPFQIIMFGEMHGTGESAPFVNGLSNLFTAHGDSVTVGFEIPSSLMSLFLSRHTDSSVYASTFFRNPPYLDGRESLPWAALIASLSGNPKATVFFYDMNATDGSDTQRDSLMFTKIKTQFLHHPRSRMILLGGNYHNRVLEPGTTASFLNKDPELTAAATLCCLNLEYLDGTCRANFGHGLETKQLGREPSGYDTAIEADRYFMLRSPQSDYPYNGFYYSRHITAARMTTQ